MKLNFDKLQAYLIGAVAGIFVAVVVSFSADWIVTASSAEEAVADSRVGLLASICAADAQASWSTQVPKPDYTGWANRDSRLQVAKQFAPVLPGKTEAAPEVVSECAKKIEDAQLAAS